MIDSSLNDGPEMDNNIGKTPGKRSYGQISRELFDPATAWQRAQTAAYEIVHAHRRTGLTEATEIALAHDRETAALAIEEYTAKPVIVEYAKCTICHLDYIPKRRPSPGRPNYCFNKECLRAKWRQYKRKQRT